ncbi:carbohydrate sulfotransferase 15-like isoform X2 [Ostrea edulis]|uniref:carbohydrate sulfotransferase 15-like isoform X2 n=1 Tax=Ostrea edulis TaxID=37623 RepID=UPI0024AEB3C8|nr:carbohydrate sulfotransferase 15-like isoform X2 [Ostrea edulis]
MKWGRILICKMVKWKSTSIICLILGVLIVIQYFAATRFSDLLHHKAPPDYQCGVHRRLGVVEDILCQEKKKFLPNFKNPCWYDPDENLMYSRLRCLPYFHIFGVCKSGTTDLFHRLKQHPQIVGNRGLLSKETWFWSWHRYGIAFPNGSNEVYLEETPTLNYFIGYFQIPKIWEMKVSTDGSRYSDIITGHGDPMDFWDNRFWRHIPQNDEGASEPTYTTANLVHHVQPNMKLILLLRDPVERLYSHYYHQRLGTSPEDFHVDVSASIRHLARCERQNTLRSCLYNQSLLQNMPTHLYASFYDVHITNWLNVFPRSQIFITRTEDFSRDIKRHLLHLFKFLDVGDVPEKVLNKMSDMSHRYRSIFKVKAGPMLNRTRRMLIDYFREPMKRLSSILNDPRYTWDDVYKELYSERLH